MIKRFRFLLMLVLSNYLYSQTDFMASHTLEIKDTNSAKISKDRKQLCSDFTNEDPKKVRDINKYLLQSDINTNKPFSFKDIDFGLEVYSGYIFYTGRLNENYANYIPVGLAIYLRYKKLDISVRNAIGFNKTKRESDYSTETLEKGYRLATFLGELSLSFEVYDRNHFKVSPFIGLGAIRLNPIRKPSEQLIRPNDPLLKSTTYNLGINFDIKKSSKNKDTTIAFFRIRYGFAMQRFSGNAQNNTGNIHYITIGYGGIGNFRNSK